MRWLGGRGGTVSGPRSKDRITGSDAGALPVPDHASSEDFIDNDVVCSLKSVIRYHPGVDERIDNDIGVSISKLIVTVGRDGFLGHGQFLLSA